MTNTIEITYHATTIGELVIGTHHKSVCLLDFRHRIMRERVDTRLKKLLRADFIHQSTDLHTETCMQVDEYLLKKRTHFDIPLLPVGTEFQKTVWNTLSTIPYGATTSYMDIATRIGNPQAVRAAASANGANAIALIIPCHRVIQTNGKIGGYGGGIAIKQQLLELEGSWTR